MVKIIHERMYFPTFTAGTWYMPSMEPICKILELPWLDNKRSISCIPEDIYLLRYNPPKEERPYGYYRFEKVQGRNNILAHRGAVLKHTLGCLLVGSRFTNATEIPSLAESTIKLQWMVENLPAEFLLDIRKKL